jgi:TRAP-type C4-dicarboxylate transport system substrate-binding protein
MFKKEEQAVKKLLLVSLMIVLTVGLIFGGCAEPTPSPSPVPSPSPAPAPDEVVTLRLHHHDTPTGDRQVILQEMADRIKTATNGRVVIEIYPSATLTSAPDAHDACMAGITDISWCMTGVSPGRYPILDIFNLPALGFNNSEVPSMCLYSIAQKYPDDLQKELESTKLLYLDTTSMDVVGTKGTAIRTVDDFTGLKLRASGANAMNHLKALGALPMMMSPGDIYTNVEKGVLDGWNMPIGGMWNFKLNEITPYCTLTHNWVGTFFTLMNLDKWNSLPGDVQDQMMSVLGADWTKWSSQYTDKAEVRVIDWAKGEGVEIIQLSAADHAKMQELAKPMWDEYIAGVEAAGLPGQAILDDIQKFIKEY